MLVTECTVSGADLGEHVISTVPDPDGHVWNTAVQGGALMGCGHIGPLYNTNITAECV